MERYELGKMVGKGTGGEVFIASVRVLSPGAAEDGLSGGDKVAIKRVGEDTRNPCGFHASPTTSCVFRVPFCLLSRRRAVGAIMLAARGTGMRVDALREIKLLQELHHKNVVRQSPPPSRRNTCRIRSGFKPLC
jgi:serine/threonine protein kinase